MECLECFKRLKLLIGLVFSVVALIKNKTKQNKIKPSHFYYYIMPAEREYQSSLMDYPVPSGQSPNHTHTGNIKQTQQVVFTYSSSFWKIWNSQIWQHRPVSPSAWKTEAGGSQVQRWRRPPNKFKASLGSLAHPYLKKLRDLEIQFFRSGFAWYS